MKFEEKVADYNNIALGTAQFGSRYGLFNKNKIVNLKEVKKIISLASNYKCNVIDTAIDYPRSEEFLGKAEVKNFDIITKFPLDEKNLIKNNRDFLLKQLEESISRLRISSLYGLLFRSPKKLLSGKFKEYWQIAQELKLEGKVKNIGISIYNPEVLEQFLDNFIPDIIQVPFNLFDQRIKKSGWLNVLYQNNVEIHARSVFFQGILLQKKKLLRNRDSSYSYIWKEYQDWLIKNNFNALDACLSFVNDEKKISKIVVGVESYEQMLEILNFQAIKLKGPLFSSDLEDKLLEAANWKISF